MTAGRAARFLTASDRNVMASVFGGGVFARGGARCVTPQLRALRGRGETLPQPIKAAAAAGGFAFFAATASAQMVKPEAVLLLLVACGHLGSPALRVQESCRHLASIFPAKLRELRLTFDRVKDYFQMKDDELDVILLKEDLLQDFMGSLGCESVLEMIHFYLEEVLPKAEANNKTTKLVLSFLGNMLLDLKCTLKRCHRFLACERRSKTMKELKETYTQMKDKGIYKAMGEFDIFINYIEAYVMERKK
ncbi:interleukin-10 [Rhinatrema bivittatum]|uniref:interleukin-10 n=1 Tax=Rhinatrema bivittatum TaxID=194408 RepID=UPI00112DA3B1|nr:interleukin-10 [Rhinatrema bivittatum]